MDQLRQSLNQTLQSVIGFYFNVHCLHWNITGKEFYQYHLLFERIYKDVYKSIDKLGETIRKVGGFAPIGLQQIASTEKAVKDIDYNQSIDKIINQLITNNGVLIEKLNNSFRLAQKDNLQGTMNLIADRIDQHMQWSWFLSATINQSGDKGDKK